MVRGLRGLLWLNTNCWLFAFAFFVRLDFSRGGRDATGLLWSCLPGSWQLPPESQLYNVTMQSSQSCLLVHHLCHFAGVNCSFVGGCRGRKGAASSSRGCLTAWHLGSVRMVSSNLVTDETGTCQTFTSWT